jgi:hypothetical protein
MKRRKLLWDSTTVRTSPSVPRKETHRQQQLPPPCTYQGLYSSYGKEWEERRKTIPIHVDISDLASFSNFPGSSGLAACTSLGEVVLFRASAASSSTSSPGERSHRQYDQENDRNGRCLIEQTPVKRWKVSQGPLTSIQVVVGGSADDAAAANSIQILVGGEEGLFSISFPHASWTAAAADAAAVSKWSSVTCRVQQQLVDEAADRVFVLGEEHGRIVQVYSLSSQKLLQSIDLGQSRASTLALAASYDDDDDDDQGPSTTTMTTTLLIGTTDSQLIIWNSPGTMEMIRLSSSDEPDSKSVGGNNSAETHPKMMLPFDVAVTSICASRDQWWTIAGSACHHHHNNNNKSRSNTTGGVLATLHGPTRTLVSCTATREMIHSIAINNDSNHGGGDPRVYTAANEGVVSVWESPYRLERQARIWTNPASGHAITSIPLGGGDSTTTTTTTTSVIAISGVGSQVDILQDACRVQSLNINQEEDKEVANRD